MKSLVNPSGSLLKHFENIDDPRREYLIEHKLLDIIAITICAVICGAESWVEIEEYGCSKQEWLKQFLTLPNGIPSRDTIRRLFAQLDPEQLQNGFLSWVKTIAELTKGEVIAIDGKTLRHSYDKGKNKGAFLGTNQDTNVYIPLTTMANQIVGNNSPFGTQVSFISATAKEQKSINAAQFQIENLLRLRHKIVDRNDFTVRTQKDILETVGTITDGLTILLAAIAGISLVVGGIGVMNIMLVSVTERTSEIGLRKAIGAKENDILTQFLIEATILSILGGAIGTVVGVGTIVLVGAVSPLVAVISPAAIVVAVTVSGSIGLFFGVIPARKAAKLDPIVALRSA